LIYEYYNTTKMEFTYEENTITDFTNRVKTVAVGELTWSNTKYTNYITSLANGGRSGLFVLYVDSRADGSVILLKGRSRFKAIVLFISSMIPIADNGVMKYATVSHNCPAYSAPKMDALMAKRLKVVIIKGGTIAEAMRVAPSLKTDGTTVYINKFVAAATKLKNEHPVINDITFYYRVLGVEMNILDINIYYDKSVVQEWAITVDHTPTQNEYNRAVKACDLLMQIDVDNCLMGSCAILALNKYRDYPDSERVIRTSLLLKNYMQDIMAAINADCPLVIKNRTPAPAAATAATTAATAPPNKRPRLG